MTTTTMSDTRSGYRLMNDFAMIMENLHGHVNERGGGAQLYPEELCAVSEEYRGSIRLASLTLQEQVKNGELTEEGSAAQRQIYAEGELIWASIEMVYLKSSESVLAGDLVACARQYHRECDEWFADIVRVDDANLKTHEHERYWPIVYMNLAYGRLEEAIQILRLHPRTTDVTGLIDMLSKAPLEAICGDEDGQTNCDEWRSWQQTASSAMGTVSADSPVSLAYQFLSGDVSALKEMTNAGFFTDWFQVIVPLTLYMQPDTTVNTLYKLTADAMTLVPPPHRRDIDECLQAVLALDLLPALKMITCRLFVAHLADLLALAGQEDMTHRRNLHPVKLSMVDGGKTHVYVNMRDSLLLQHVQSLATHPSTMAMTFAYVTACADKVAAREVLDTTMRSIKDVSAFTDRHWLVVERLCNRAGVQETWRKLCARKVECHIGKKELSVALAWSIRSGDAALVNQVAELCVQQPNIADMRALDFTEQMVDRCPSLLSLCQYQQIALDLRANRLTSALDGLCLLLGDSGPALKPSLVEQVEKTCVELVAVWSKNHVDETNKAETMNNRTVYRLQSQMSSLLVDMTTFKLGDAYGGGEKMTANVRACQKQLQKLIVLHAMQ